MAKKLRSSIIPYVDYEHGFYDSETLFRVAEIMAKRIEKIVKKQKLSKVIFASASSSGSTITTAVMSFLHNTIPCSHVYVKKDSWSFRADDYNNDDRTVIKNYDALYMKSTGHSNDQKNIFILDDLIDTGVTIDAIYKELKNRNREGRLNRVIVQCMHGSSKGFAWNKFVEYYI